MENKFKLYLISVIMILLVTLVATAGYARFAPASNAMIAETITKCPNFKAWALEKNGNGGAITVLEAYFPQYFCEPAPAGNAIVAEQAKALK